MKFITFFLFVQRCCAALFTFSSAYPGCLSASHHLASLDPNSFKRLNCGNQSTIHEFQMSWDFPPRNDVSVCVYKKSKWGHRINSCCFIIGINDVIIRSPSGLRSLIFRALLTWLEFISWIVFLVSLFALLCCWWMCRFFAVLFCRPFCRDSFAFYCIVLFLFLSELLSYFPFVLRASSQSTKLGQDGKETKKNLPARWPNLSRTGATFYRWAAANPFQPTRLTK